MLVLTRKPGQGLWIGLHEGVAPSMTVKELFAQGPIRVMVTQVMGTHVKLGITADRQFRILRDELLPRESV